MFLIFKINKLELIKLYRIKIKTEINSNHFIYTKLIIVNKKQVNLHVYYNPKEREILIDCSIKDVSSFIQKLPKEKVDSLYYDELKQHIIELTKYVRNKNIYILKIYFMI